MILFILPSFSGGGAERVSINIIRHLHYRGYTVGVLVFSDSGPLLSALPNGVQVFNLKTVTLTRSFVTLIKKIYSLKPKIIFSTFGYINIALIVINLFLKKKFSIWIREANLPSISIPNNKYSAFIKFSYKVLYKYSDRIICSSKRMRLEFINTYKIPRSKLNILHNPVDIKLIRESIIDTSYINCNGSRFVAAGRLTKQKGFDRIIKWMSIIEDKSATLVILGDGPLKKDLINLAHKYNVEDRVIFTGYVKNPWSWFAGADAFVLPSRWEGMPNAALEALACGTLVISTSESGGISEVKKHCTPGSVFVASTQDSFVKAMNMVESQKKYKPRESLLDKRYYIDNSIDEIENWIKS
jgi:glycosyltransferase involved in cell wall biosynthesis